MSPRDCKRWPMDMQEGARGSQSTAICRSGRALFFRIFCAFYFAAGLGVGAFIFTRRESFEAVGGFDEQYFAGEEVYLTLALKKLGRFKILREPIITSARKLRMHSAALCSRAKLLHHSWRTTRAAAREKLALWRRKREHPAVMIPAKSRDACIADLRKRLSALRRDV